jgi:hypothetical protein
MAVGMIVLVCSPPEELKQHYSSYVLGGLKIHIAAEGRYMKNREMVLPV